MFFLFPLDAAHFILCTLLCALYLSLNLLVQWYWLVQHKKMCSTKQIVVTNLYALAMSTPLMPFVFKDAAIIYYPVTIIGLFALSNLIWQLIFVQYHVNKNAGLHLIALSLSNLIAWSGMYYVNYRFFMIMMQQLKDVGI